MKSELFFFDYFVSIRVDPSKLQPTPQWRGRGKNYFHSVFAFVSPFFVCGQRGGFGPLLSVDRLAPVWLRCGVCCSPRQPHTIVFPSANSWVFVCDCEPCQRQRPKVPIQTSQPVRVTVYVCMSVCVWVCERAHPPKSLPERQTWTLFICISVVIFKFFFASFLSGILVRPVIVYFCIAQWMEKSCEMERWMGRKWGKRGGTSSRVRKGQRINGACQWKYCQKESPCRLMNGKYSGGSVSESE